MEYILIENYIYTGVEWEGKTYRPDAIYTFCKNSNGATYDGYYPPKIEFYINKHLSNEIEEMGMFVIKNQSTFDAFYNDLQLDPDIQVDFVAIPQNFKYE